MHVFGLDRDDLRTAPGKHMLFQQLACNQRVAVAVFVCGKNHAGTLQYVRAVCHP